MSELLTIMISGETASGKSSLSLALRNAIGDGCKVLNVGSFLAEQVGVKFKEGEKRRYLIGKNYLQSYSVNDIGPMIKSKTIGLKEQGVQTLILDGIRYLATAYYLHDNLEDVVHIHIFEDSDVLHTRQTARFMTGANKIGREMLNKKKKFDSEVADMGDIADLIVSHGAIKANLDSEIEDGAFQVMKIVENLYSD